MVDIQTYRARIGSASGIMDSILRRKTTKFKLGASATHQEDEDLLRKFLKTMTVSRIHMAYLILVILLITFNITKCSPFRHSLFWIEYIYHVGRECTAIFVQYYHDWTCTETVVEFTVVPGKYTLDWTSTHENSVTFPKGVYFSIACGELCLSSIGAVHFISILLLIAGVEPNPGPKGKKENTQDDPNVTNPDNISTASSKSVSSQNGVSTAGSAVSQVPVSVHQESSNKEQEDTKTADVSAANKKKGFKARLKLKFPIKKNKKHGTSDVVSSSMTSLDSTQEENNEPANVNNVRSVLVEKDDKTTKLDLRNRNIDKDMLQQLLDEIDLPYYDIKEVDLRDSTFCLLSWSEHPDGNREKEKLLRHQKLQQAEIIDDDSSESAKRQSSIEVLTSENPKRSSTRHSVAEMPGQILPRHRSFGRAHSLPVFPRIDVSGVDFADKGCETESIPETVPDSNSRSENLDIFETTLRKREYFCEKTSQSETIVEFNDDKTILTMQHTNISKELLEKFLDQSSPNMDIIKVDFSRSTFSPLYWAKDLNEILDEHIRHPRLQAVATWCLNSIKLSKIPAFWEKSNHPYYHRLVDLDLSNNQLISLPKLFHLPRLKSLNLEENPMFEIAALDKLPNLETVRIGSEQTRTIHRDLLTRILSGHVTVEVLPQYAQELRAPRYDILTSRAATAVPNTYRAVESNRGGSEAPVPKTLKDYLVCYDSMRKEIQGKVLNI